MNGDHSVAGAIGRSGFAPFVSHLNGTSDAAERNSRISMTLTPPTFTAGAARPLAAFAVFMLSLTGLAVAVAKPIADHRGHVVERVVGAARDVAQARKAETVQTRIVWRGDDVDGDGAGDFANPTGAAPRGHDHFGDGRFGARRDGGTRRHEGVDYAAVADQTVGAPISGFVTKIGYAYGGDDSLKFVEITNPAIGYVARAFYVDPSVQVGQAVRLGQSIGAAASLQSHYPGITDHVHLEIFRPGGARLNATALIVPREIIVRG